MRQLSEAILIFITFFIKINSQKTEEKQETKPDPFFQEWKENAWQRPTQCQGKWECYYMNKYSIDRTRTCVETE